MKIKLFFPKTGRDSKFSFLSLPWAYKSKFEDWSIVRVFGIYIWFYPKTYQIGKGRK